MARSDSDSASFHRGNYIQRGRGLGSFLGSLLTGAKEVGRKIISSPIAQDVLKAAKKSAIEAGINVATDTLRGKKKFSSSVRDNLSVAKSAIADAIESSTNPPKNKKKKVEIVAPLPTKQTRNVHKKTMQTHISRRKKKFNDIFG
jgi:hypothetical protein